MQNLSKQRVTNVFISKSSLEASSVTSFLNVSYTHTNYVWLFILLQVINSKLGMYDLQVLVMCVIYEQILFIKFSDKKNKRLVQAKIRNSKKILVSTYDFQNSRSFHL